MQASINSHQAAGMFPFASYFLPLLPQLHEFEDQDMQKHATILAQYYPHFPHAPFFVTGIIKQLIGMLLHPDAGWHSKVQVLPILQVLYYLHLPLMDASIESSVMDCLSTLLNDAQVEVRAAAAVTLSGLIRCSGRKSIEGLLATFRARLKGLPSVNRRVRAASVERGESVSRLDGDVVRKHSVVLGLSSIVLAFPV
jgi:proteasome activator subunit 4